MTKTRKFGSIAVLLAAGVLIGASADRAISRMDIREMSDAEKNRQVRQDLLSILRPSTSLFEGNTRTIGDVWLHTRASAAPYRSLCQRDTVKLYYAPVGKAGRAEEWPSRPYKIESERSYRFVSPPKGEYLVVMGGPDDNRSPFASECRAADKQVGDYEWAGWFTANNPEAAMSGGFAMLALQDWLAKAGSQFENCVTAADSGECKTLYASAVRLDMIEGVSECTPAKPDETCVALGKYGTMFTINARKTGGPMRVEDIRRVTVEDTIVVT